MRLLTRVRERFGIRSVPAAQDRTAGSSAVTRRPAPRTAPPEPALHAAAFSCFVRTIASCEPDETRWNRPGSATPIRAAIASSCGIKRRDGCLTQRWRL